MASVRAIKLAKYFAQQNHEVTVLTSFQRDTWTKGEGNIFETKGVEDIYAAEDKIWSFIFDYLSLRKKRGITKLEKQTNIGDNKYSEAGRKVNFCTSIKNKLIAMLSWLFYFLVTIIEDASLFRSWKKKFIELDLPYYDAVIGTYPNVAALMMGAWIKQRKKCGIFVADFRDPLYNPGFKGNYIENYRDLRILKNILKKADRIVCVSNGIAEGINEIANLKIPISVLYNGFDRDDLSFSGQNMFDDQKVHFVYTGSLYKGRRSVEMLSKIIRNMIDKAKIEKDSFVFDYAGADFSILQDQLRNSGLMHTAKSHGFVSRDYSLQMQKSADVLILLTWNEKNYKGVIPGKLFEYMMLDKIPIIALVTGSEINSEVSEIIEKAELGYVCEEARGGCNEAFEHYLERIFSAKKEPALDELQLMNNVEIFNYKNISQNYSDFIFDYSR
jgi:glycosyltransferase involved in cell wall biosynthesis